jgi:hypothetical protein
MGLSLSAAALTSGCATIVHSSDSPKLAGQPTQWVEITSDPSGARVTFRDADLGRTPLRVALPRRDTSIVLRVSLDGYEPRHVPVPRAVSGAVAGNLGFAALGATPSVGFADPPKTRQRVAMVAMFPALFMLVDFGSGQAYTLPKRVHAALTPVR